MQFQHKLAMAANSPDAQPQLEFGKCQTHQPELSQENLAWIKELVLEPGSTVPVVVIQWNPWFNSFLQSLALHNNKFGTVAGLQIIASKRETIFYAKELPFSINTKDALVTQMLTN